MSAVAVESLKPAHPAPAAPATAPPTATERVTPEEYLRRERLAEFRSEYRDGEIVAMAGASLSHIRIDANLMAELGAQLKGKPWEPMGQDAKIRATRMRYSYPDVTVVCGEPEFLDERRDVITNPTVLFEILSPSTEVYDRGEKFAAYQQRPTLQDYVLVAQDRVSVEHYSRQDENGGVWRYERLDRPDAVLRLPSVGCEVLLSDIYARVTFPEPEPVPGETTNEE